MLAAPVLALHDDPGRDVGQAHGRVGLVDVLPARPAGAEGVHSHIGRVDVNFNRIIHLGVDKHAGKTGVAPARAVKRRFAHQAVHAGFGAQQAESVFALDLDRGALDAGNIACGLILHRGGETFALGVAQVLPQQHAGPIAGFGATGTGLDVQKCVHGIGRVVEHAAEFQALNHFGQALRVGLNHQQPGFVALFARHLKQLRVIRQVPREPVQRQHHAFQRLFFFAQLLGALRVVPDAGIF